MQANNLGQALASYVGSTDLAVSETVRRELALTRYDDLRAKWFALIDGTTLVVETDEIVDLADDLFERFEDHDDEPEAADALIAAAALVTGRTLITVSPRRNASTTCLSRQIATDRRLEPVCRRGRVAPSREAERVMRSSSAASAQPPISRCQGAAKPGH